MKKTVLFYKDILYKSILAILICIAFIWPAGCGEAYRNDGTILQERNGMLLLERDRLKREGDALAQKTSAFVEKYELLNMRLTAFTTGLSDEELKVYEKFLSAAGTNRATYELNKRALDKVLTEENAPIFAALKQECADLELERNELIQTTQLNDQRLALYNEKLQAYQQAVVENQRARQAAGRVFGQALQQASQDYYNRQMEAHKDYNQRSMMQFDLQESQRRQTNRLLNAMRGY